MGKDFLMAEDGKEEDDRLIMFAMSKINIVLLLYCIFNSDLHSKQYKELLEYFKKR